MGIRGITLARHVSTHHGTRLPNTDLALILERIEQIGKRIARELAHASLGGQLGYSGATNIQGEQVKTLDQWTNQVFLEAFAHRRPVCCLVSEEMEHAVHAGGECGDPSYAILFDPLDGSSNIDVNGSLGSIFSIHRRAPDHGAAVADILRPGADQVAAGYLLYGPSTQLIYTAGEGVDIFTLDHRRGEFVLWREGVKMPPRGTAYAVNQGNISKFHPGARKFVEHLTSRKDKSTSYSLRYSGAFAADFHRCLLEGGLYLYPGEVTPDGRTKGKLRLMYELAPMAMIVEQAGGKASTGKSRILDLIPESLHDRAPIYIGSAAEVELAELMQVEG
ncbi:MAG TPA: class 1 fructose-bisphosphatase [Candidatus Binataceae bacterium]|nr:class 1 fructose-bisphosphatase [Candidatus Binataceae bacterium]